MHRLSADIAPSQYQRTPADHHRVLRRVHSADDPVAVRPQQPSSPATLGVKHEVCLWTPVILQQTDRCLASHDGSTHARNGHRGLAATSSTIVISKVT